MSWVDRIARRVKDRYDDIPTGGPLSRHDARLWREVEDLDDIGELTARWLEGDIETHPGYYGRPDLETEELIPTLANLNRSGYITTGSQPGIGPIQGYDDRWWWQRAAVDGFARPETADRIWDGADQTGLVVVEHDRAGWRTSWADSVVVTASGPDNTRDEPCEGRSRVHTHFGTHLSRRTMLGEVFGGTTRAPRMLYNTPQVTVVDPQWGRNELLWPTLTDSLTRSRDLSELTRDDAQDDSYFESLESEVDPLTRERRDVIRSDDYDIIGAPSDWDREPVGWTGRER